VTVSIGVVQTVLYFLPSCRYEKSLGPGAVGEMEAFFHTMMSPVLKLSRNAPGPCFATFLNARTPFRHFLPIQLFYSQGVCEIRCHQMRFSSSKIHQNAYAAGASPPDSTEGAYSALTGPRRWLSGGCFAAEGEEERRRQGKEGREGKGREGSVLPLLFLQFNHCMRYRTNSEKRN